MKPEMINRRKHFVRMICFFLLFFATHAFAQQQVPAALKPALQGIRGAGMLQYVKVLSSDEFEGRAPGSPGEELTVNYISGNFKKIGLKPGNPDGSYVQQVPLYGYKSDASAYFTANDKKIPLQFPDNYVAVSRSFNKPEIKVEGSELVFVGYGIVAPEYGWDDYKGVDVKGKTIVMLVNDPPIPDPSDPSRLDNKMFKGKAMTYYGRWTYKYEIASEKGAAAAIIIHETGPAGYPFEVVTGSWGHENFDILDKNNTAYRVAVESWINLDKAKELFAACGKSFDELKKQAATKSFRPVPLQATVNFDIKNTVREVNSKNVCALLEGSDAKLKNEYIIYTAHWDHLGKDPSLKGDQIYNGALDNASGVAGLLELATAFTRVKPKRSVLFVAVTAEEQGLLGTKYYATHPLYPLQKTVADINMDVINPWSKTSDIIVVGMGQSFLEDTLAKVAAAFGRKTKPEEEPEKGSYYRSDHFEFAKKGVPALYVEMGTDFIGKPKGYGKQKSDEYTSNDYHKPSDEIKPDWDFSGGVEDLKLLFLVGYKLAQSKNFPGWKTGSEFKAIREEMMKK